jgi:diguanylate cyclase (GGDEF)-like protein
MSLWTDTRLIAYTAGAIYAGAALVGLLEAAVPGGQELSALPSVAALVVACAIATVGARLSRPVLAALGPIGVLLIGHALATTEDYGDGAVLYMWPVLWMASFYGTRGTVGIVACVAVVHGGALLMLPTEMNSIDRWIDVVVAVAVVAAVVRFLVARIEALVDDLRAEARVDSLTGLLNRRGFEERFDVEVTRALRDGAPLAAVRFDIDDFKRVNDTSGHEIADRALVWLGATLRDHARHGDILARVGGDELVVVLPRASAADAVQFAERIRARVERGEGSARFGVGENLRMTLSAGVAAIPGVDVNELLDEADGALYAAKRAGRNRVEAPAEVGAI